MPSLTRFIRAHLRTLALWLLVCSIAAVSVAVLAALGTTAPRSRIDLP